MRHVDLNHEVHGPPDGQPVVLVHSLGMALGLWDRLATALIERYRVVRLDLRGHGWSPAPHGPYTVDVLADDVLRLAGRLGLDRFALVGLSIGGTVGQTIAVREPDRLTALAACCTGPKLGDPDDWRDRAARVRAEGTSWLVDPSIARWFTPAFAARHPDEVDRVVRMLLTTSPEGYAASCEALAAFDLTDRIGEITAPTRVVIGSEDPIAPPDLGHRMADAIPDADLVVLDGTAHLANVGQPDRFNAAVLEHLEKHL
ncbi:MAG TPA: 3-oxoadipate enol-lactonase [Nocardioidaceae bacterium]|nr:3-oxoadipate enol-lactonase [Nocardioidaceae bacterium]